MWKTKSSAIEQRAKLEEDREDESYDELDDVQTVLSTGDVSLSKEYTVEHPVDVRSLFFFLPIGLDKLILFPVLFGCCCEKLSVLI